MLHIGAPPSVPVGVGGTPQVPVLEPGGMSQVRPWQQSPLVVQLPPDMTQALPQRSTPLLSGTHGAVLQHSDENLHSAPAAMQHGAVPV